MDASRLTSLSGPFPPRKPGEPWWEPMFAFIATTPAAFPSRLQPLPRKASRALYPYPKCAALFSDGSELRLSCWVDAKKPTTEDATRTMRAIATARGLDIIKIAVVGLPEKAQPARKETAAQKLAAIVQALKDGAIDVAIALAEKA